MPLPIRCPHAVHSAYVATIDLNQHLCSKAQCHIYKEYLSLFIGGNQILYQYCSILGLTKHCLNASLECLCDWVIQGPFSGSHYKWYMHTPASEWHHTLQHINSMYILKSYLVLKQILIPYNLMRLLNKTCHIKQRYIWFVHAA